MGRGRSWRGWTALAGVVLLGCETSGCGGSAGPSLPPEPGLAAPTGAGTLTVSVEDPEGRPLADAFVYVSGTKTPGGTPTSATGVATIGSVPARARLSVSHEFGEYYVTNVDVAQEGVTFLAVTLQAGRPRPTVALLPVLIPTGSVSADRSELTLHVTIVASASAPFSPAAYGDSSSTPSLGLHLGQRDATDSRRQCFVWLDRTRTVPSCDTPWGESPYTVSVEHFNYDRIGTVPMLAERGRARSAMLLMDQSARVSALDPGTRRSFAARRFIARAVTSSEPQSLSVAGLAGDSRDPAAPASLPERPLWVPLGAATVFSTDRAELEAAVAILEPLVGGSAPVFDALRAALTLTAVHAPPGNRAVIALLAGGDDRISEAERPAALASLRRQRDDARIQSVLIGATPGGPHPDRLALAELAAALRAPAIFLGVKMASGSGFLAQTWGGGSYAALDLAADLIDGVPLPTLSAVFRVHANQPGAFAAGATLHGVLYLESDICPMGCWELPLEFAVEIP
jgi:hypothetical protein